MKYKEVLSRGSRRSWSLNSLTIRSVIMLGIFSIGLQAQEDQYSRPSLWFGISEAANINLFRGSIQELNSDFTSPVPFTNGMGVVLSLEPFVEFHPAGSRWGIMLKAGFDDRAGELSNINKVVYSEQEYL